MPDVAGAKRSSAIALSINNADDRLSAPAFNRCIMRTDELDFDLPPELIAQTPTADRAASRLMHYRAADRSIAHRQFSDLPSLLRPGDLLIFNDARVIPARFTLRKGTGGRVEGLFLAEVRPGRWHVLLRNLGTHAGSLHFAAAPEILVTPIRFGDGGEYEIDVHADEPALVLLSRIGRMPLPPYIKRDKDADPRDQFDRERYQTIFARAPGSVAAPTAGLHFTEPILADLASHGVEHTFVTLHVGLGTFKPITADTLEGHAMHSEAYSISPEAADALNRAKHERRRIIAVGTTATRVLESHPAKEPFIEKTAETSIFIHPPYRWRHVDALITNFHLPRSTLIALVAARIGLDEQRRLYRVAIEERYRFFSYGDAMFVE
jgi:S-adenosylmethionine:tRNA ribosyltransferase-isomerase